MFLSKVGRSFHIMICSVELQFAGIKLDFSIQSDILFINTSLIVYQ